MLIIRNKSHYFESVQACEFTTEHADVIYKILVLSVIISDMYLIFNTVCKTSLIFFIHFIQFGQNTIVSV